MESVRFATVDDLPNLAQLYRETVLAIAPLKYTPQQVQAWADALSDGQKFREFIFNATTYIMEDAEGIIGFGGLQTNGHIASLYVRHDRNRQGIGRSLLLIMIEAAKKQRITRLYAEASEFSVGLFRKMGFTIFDTEFVYYGEVKFYRYMVEMLLSS